LKYNIEKVITGGYLLSPEFIRCSCGPWNWERRKKSIGKFKYEPL